MLIKKAKSVLTAVTSLVLAFGFFFAATRDGISASAANFSKTEITTIINDAQAKIDGLYDVDADGLEEKISKATDYMNASNMDSATQTAYEVLAMQSDSPPVTARSVWHRPTEKSLAELEASLDVYQSIGINLVFVETFYHGYSMFKSDYVPYYAGFETANYGEHEDYLHAFAALAAERGIETHAWVENFYVGVNQYAPFVQDHSSWIMYNNELTGSGDSETLTYLQRGEGGAYIFIDPANKSVCDFLINYYNELLEKNPLVKGLNLDYIRYPVSSQSQDTGFTRKSMYGFAEYINRADELNPFDSLVEMYKDFQTILNGNYQAWCNYRTGLITDFVRRIRMEVKADSDLVLSTAVFSSLSDTISKKKQDWKTWFSNGWVDIATPMAYLDTAAQIKSGVQSMISAAGQNCYYYTGLAPSYRGFPAYQNVTQIQASYDGGANGYAIFCATQVLGMTDVQQILGLVNSKPAVLPHAATKTVVKAYVDTISRRADEIYIPAGAMTQAQKTALMEQLNQLLAIEGTNATQIAAIRSMVERLNELGYTSYASGNAKTRITELMEDCYQVLSVKFRIATNNETLFPPTPDDEGGENPEPDVDSSSSSSSSSESTSGSSSSESMSSGDSVTADSSSSSSSKTTIYLTGCTGSVNGGAVIALTIMSAALIKRKKRKNFREK